MYEPKFFTLEGADGSGKGTQIAGIKEYLRTVSAPYFITREPRKPTKELIESAEEEIRKSNGNTQRGFIFASHFLEDRVKHIEEEIIPSLKEGKIVVCDRYSWSTMAYQTAQGMNMDKLLKMHIERNILRPDRVYFLDISLEETRRRIEERNLPKDIFEKEVENTQRVIENYRKLYEMSQKDPESILGKSIKINAEQSREFVLKDILKDLIPQITGII